MKNLNQNCPCKNAGCPRHGDCEACKAFHHGKENPSSTSCERLCEKSASNDAKA